jgi:predicted acyl esterase
MCQKFFLIYYEEYLRSTEKSESTNVLSQENVTMETQRTNYGELKETPIEKEDLVLTEEWDKVFPKSDKVNHRKVTFVNRFGITLAADLYEPKDAEGKLPAIAVAGPFGAVKEQSNGLYAQEMAER